MAFSMIPVSSQGGAPDPYTPYSRPHPSIPATPPPKLVQKSDSSLVFNPNLPPLHPQIPRCRMYTCQCMGM